MTGDTPAKPAAALIWCPFPDHESAIMASNSLLDEGLVACANILPAMVSLFSWQGNRSEANETGVLLKSNGAVLRQAIARLEQLHPYDEPAILAWHCDEAGEATRAWLGGLKP